jgi:hypothetical protein
VIGNGKVSSEEDVRELLLWLGQLAQWPVGGADDAPAGLEHFGLCR